MKKLNLLLVALLFTQVVFAQTYYDHNKSDRLAALVVTIIPSGPEVSTSLSAEADKALKSFVENDSSVFAFPDFLPEKMLFFIKILTKEEAEDPEVLNALMDMEDVWTNEMHGSMVYACMTKATVGASYVNTYDEESEEVVGVFLIIFK